MGDEPIAVCHYRDVTDERALTKRMIESEKMIAIGNLAGGVAHEINNPLGGILAFSQLMKRDAGRTPQDMEALELIEESAMRCKRIVESLLKFSRRSKVEDRRTFDLNKCVDDAAVLFRAQIKKYPRAKMDVRLAESLPAVYGNPDQLVQVYLNLAKNAADVLKETGHGGEILFTTAFRPGMKLQVAGTSERVSLPLEICIHDNGKGIPEELAPHIFEPFVTTKPQGRGLGLALVAKVVRDHGGTVECQPRRRGTTFRTLLPMIDPGSGLVEEGDSLP